MGTYIRPCVAQMPREYTLRGRWWHIGCRGRGKVKPSELTTSDYAWKGLRELGVELVHNGVAPVGHVRLSELWTDVVRVLAGESTSRTVDDG